MKENTRKSKDASRRSQKPASPDTLVKSDKTLIVELSEDELKDVSGGGLIYHKDT